MPIEENSQTGFKMLPTALYLFHQNNFLCVSPKNIFDVVNISSHTVLIKVNSFTTLH